MSIFFQKSKTLFTVSILILSMLLAGCDASNISFTSDDQTDGAESEDASQKLIVWGLFENEKNIEPLLERFGQKFPDIEVDYVQKDAVAGYEVGNYTNDLNKVLTDGNPNTTPDVYMIHNTWVGDYQNYYNTAPEAIYPYSEFESDMHLFVSDEFGHGKRVRGVPLWVDMLGLVYNEDYLLEAGHTSVFLDWDSFQSQAKDMTTTAASGGISRGGFAAGIHSNVEFAPDLLNLFLLQGRKSELTDGENKTVPFLNNEEDKKQATDAVAFFKSFNSSNKTWDSRFKLDTAAFLEGDLAALVVPSWRLENMLSVAKNSQIKDKIKVSEMPQLGFEDADKVNVSTYWGYVVSKDSKNQTAAWQFLKFLSTEEAQQLYANTTKTNGRQFAPISARKSLANSQSDNIYLKPYYNSIPYTKNWFMTNGSKVEVQYRDLIDGKIDADELLVKVDEIRENSGKL